MDYGEGEPSIERFIESIPEKSRELAIERARASKERILLNAWRRERKLLSNGFIKEHKLTDDLQGWEKYLSLCFEREKEHYKRFGFNDWKPKYIAQMMNTRGYDDYLQALEMGFAPRTAPSESFMDYYIKSGGGGDPEIWWGQGDAQIDEDSLLVHSLDKKTLEKVIRSGVVGRDGNAELSMCQDRIVYNDGYVIIWQASDLIKVGYPLLKIREDSRDADILNEWRSVIPVDARLARLIVPTSQIPDRHNASRAQIADSFFGVEFLRSIPRI